MGGRVESIDPSDRADEQLLHCGAIGRSAVDDQAFVHRHAAIIEPPQEQKREVDGSGTGAERGTGPEEG